MKLSEHLKKRGVVPKPTPAPAEGPLWKGPEADGVTFSMLTRFLSCRERFRLAVIEGLRPRPTFNHRIEYGQMWHTCEEALAKGAAWNVPLREHAARLAREYPLQQEQVDHWYQICKRQFPLYVDYWKRQPDEKERTPLFQEQVFSVAYRLPSGRTVRLRGKWDAVDLVGKGKSAGIYLMENKTKGDIDEQQIKRQLSFDLQTCLYLVTLREYYEWDESAKFPANVPILGVRYNVVRRPLSGGKGSIVRHKPTKSNPLGETKDQFYARLAQYIKDEPQTYFMRWKVGVSAADLERFRKRCLNPILEQLCDWYEWVTLCLKRGQDPFVPRKLETENEFEVRTEWAGKGVHWQHPFGSVNWLDEGGSSDVDAYLTTGSEAGLVRVEKLFTELE